MIKLDENKNLFLSVKIKNRNQTTDLNKIYLSKFYLYMKILEHSIKIIYIFSIIYFYIVTYETNLIKFK